MAKRISIAKIDAEIERIYYANFRGVEIDIMDISKVFAAGRKAAAEGRNIEDAVKVAVQQLRKN